MQFLYGDRELIIVAGDLLEVEVDVIVSPADCDLSHRHPLAARINSAAGHTMTEQCSQLIRQYDRIDSGMSVFTSAGRLPHDAVVHAVSPMMGEGEEQIKMQQVVSRTLMMCEANDWSSIAFPALGTHHFQIPLAVCAQAFFRSIISFWDARFECSVGKVILCVNDDELQPFFDAFREDAINTEDVIVEDLGEEGEEPTGYIELDEEDINALNDPEIEDWFK